MDYWGEIVGQAAAVRTLQQAATPGGPAPAHAWLITGPPGSGRSNIAYRFAAALIARDEASREAVFAQVRAQTHPDLGVLTTQAAIIKIDAAREVVASSYYSPADGRYRVIVIEDADRMTEHTSNVLLKALEEPPERTVWVLCAPSEADLLPTIRSRTRALRLVTPQPSEIAQLLAERDGIAADLAERAARLAQSHIGMARRLAGNSGAMERRDQTLDLVTGLYTLGDAMHAAAKLLKIAEADAAAIGEVLDSREREEAMRSLGLAAGTAIPPQMRSQMRALEEDQKRRSKRSLIDGIDRILTDLLSFYRDVLLTALCLTSGDSADTAEAAANGASTLALVNSERADLIHDTADRWGAERALSAVSAIENARERLLRAITPGLVLEAMLAAIVTGAMNAAGATAGAPSLGNGR